MDHLCHAVGCLNPVPPARLMCLKHWKLVPKPLQRRVWATYRPGQEVDKQPSRDYMIAQQAAIHAVAVREGKDGTVNS